MIAQTNWNPSSVKKKIASSINFETKFSQNTNVYQIKISYSSRYEKCLNSDLSQKKPKNKKSFIWGQNGWKKRESRLKILNSFNCDLRRFQKTSYKVLVVLLLFLLVSRFYNSGGNFWLVIWSWSCFRLSHGSDLLWKRTWSARLTRLPVRPGDQRRRVSPAGCLSSCRWTDSSRHLNLKKLKFLF